MKILMICDFFHESQQYQENLLTKYYLKFGHEVTILASTFNSIFDYKSGNYNKEKEGITYSEDGCKIIRKPYSINVFNRLRKLRHIKATLIKESPDLIFVHGLPLNLFEPIAYKKKNPHCRLVFDSHADYSNSAQNPVSLFILHRFIYRTIFRLIHKKPDKIFYITPETKLFLNREWGIPNHRMTFLPLGADTDYIKEIRTKNIRESVRRSFHIDENDFVVFTGGKFSRDKKTELVIKSFLLLNKKKSHLIIVGDGTDATYKNELISLSEGHQEIHFTNWIEGKDVYQFMLASDVAVFPASQSVIWQQAIGTGLPLIIGKTKGQDAEYLNRNDNLFLIEEERVNERSIFDLLNLLISDVNLLETMKMGAFKTTDEFLSYDKISQLSIQQ
jgi:glycosyltransferase involved in cell wall biosynthesis